MELGLSNRKAFITGTSRGIGLAIAKAFAVEGVHFVLFGRDQVACEALADELRTVYPGQKSFAVWHDFH
jgi:short-subunit dehydrogenase